MRLLSRRKQAEEALRDLVEKYRLLLEHAGEAIVVIQDGLAKFANPRTMELSGYSSDELSPRPFIELVHPDDREIAINRHLATLKGEELLPAYYTYRIIVKGGDTKWAETTATQVTWEGKPAVLVFLTDVTERKQTEEALRRSEERYRSILEDMKDNYFEVDLAGNFTFVNDSTCRSLGYSKEEVIGISYKAFTVDKDVETVYRAFNQVYLTGEPVRDFSWEIVRKDRAKGFVEASVFPLRDEKEEIIGFRGIGRDVTERRKAEMALRESEECYRALFDRSVDCVYVHDFEGNFIDANDAALKLLDYQREELSSLNFVSLLSQDQIPKAFETVKELKDTGSQEEINEFKLRCKNGE
jgi:PAS domain S-box-containing protein